jgi:type IV secretion system protein VirB9
MMRIPFAAPLLSAILLAPVQGSASTPADPARVVEAANRQATYGPAAQDFVNAVHIYPYVEGAIYRAVTAPERVTDIALQAGETLVSVASGDTVRWVIGDTTSGAGLSKRTHVLVKPVGAGLATNLVITTDRRSYHVALTSVARTAMTALSWSYPQDALLAVSRPAPVVEALTPSAAAPGLEVEQLRFNYLLSGDKPAWRPLRAFDDGRQTYLEFPPTFAVGEAPPLFLIGADGEPQLVNYRVRGRFYVVDRIFDIAELRLGTKKQQIVRIQRVGEAVRSRSGS